MNKTFHGIPVYSALIDSEDTGMIRISLVDLPAVESDFLAFDEQKAAQLFSVQDEEKRLVRGVVMRADFPIYRESPTLGAYYVVYTKGTIREMAEKYLADSRQNNVDLMHDGKEVDGVQMVQYFIKDTAAGINPEGFENIADGSLFAEFHVLRDDIWEDIKAGVFKGFSLEGVFTMVPEQFSKISNTSKFMSKMKKIKEAIRRALVAFAEVTTDKGILGWDSDEDLKAGDEVYIVNEDGSRGEAADGEYVTEDNKTIVVEGGRVSEIRDPEAEVETEEEFGEVSTDGGILYHDSDEDLKEGDAVFVEDEEGNRTAAPDGQYKTEDGKTITVVDGKVASIEDPEAEVAPEEEYRRVRVQHEESYDEKYRKIAEAIAALGYEDYYVETAGDDFAVICVWEDMAEKHWRFAISWNEAGEALVDGEPVEVKLMFVPVDMPSPFGKGAAAAEEEAAEEAEDLRAQLAALRKENAVLKKKPAAKPAHEEVLTHSATTPTGIKGLGRLAARLKK